MKLYLTFALHLLALFFLTTSCTSSSPKNQINNVQYQPPPDVDTAWAEPPSAEAPENSSATIPHSYFDWPVDQARLTRGFFLVPPRGKSKRPHLGIDLAAPKGTSIYAAHEGTVIYVGRAFKGFGKMIMIEGKMGWATLYAHLTKSRVKEGQQVRQGDLIGDMGRTGRATGVHLHFEIRKQSGPVDPLRFLPKSPRFAGLPAKIENESAPENEDFL